MQCSSAAGCTTCAPSPEPGTPCMMPTDPPSSPWKRRPRQPDAKSPAPRRTRDDEPAAATHATGAPAPQRARDEELRLYGFNAVQAVFARRPQAIRKRDLAGARIPQLQPLGRAHVCTPAINAHLVCRLLLEHKKSTTH